MLEVVCIKEGLVKDYINASEPQRIVELMSRTLPETIYKMLSSVGMARRFLTDALNITSYLMNKSPSTMIG